MAASSMQSTKRRIKSVSSTMKITKAMELTAVSKLQKTKSRFEANREYNDTFKYCISNALAGVDEEDEGKVLTIAIDDAGNPVVKPVDMGDVGTGGGNGGGSVEDVISAYTVTYLNGDHPEMTNVGQAIDHIMDTIKNLDFEVKWSDIKNKPKIGTKLELDEDSLNLLSNKDVELSTVPLMTDDDIFDLINDLD
jgi:F-type H+-transporting ATPase subunit gamma